VLEHIKESFAVEKNVRLNENTSEANLDIGHLSLRVSLNLVPAWNGINNSILGLCKLLDDSKFGIKYK